MNGTCPHHEHINNSINRIDETCRCERASIWKEINGLKTDRTTDYRLAIVQLVLIIATLVTVFVKG